MVHHEADAGLSGHMRKGMVKLFILFSLSRGRKHGYLLMKSFRERAHGPAGQKPVGVGEFYSALDCLEDAGLIRSEWAGRKKIFSVTSRGRAVVQRAKRHFMTAMRMFREVVPELFAGGKGAP